MDTDQEPEQRIRSDHIDDDINSRFNPRDTSRNLSSAESGSNSSISPAAQAAIDQIEAYKNDPSRLVREQEANGAPQEHRIATPFRNNVTEKVAIAGKIGAVYKKKKQTALFGLISLLLAGSSIPFLSAASLPFAIIGNMNAKSVMHGAQAYLEDYIGFKLFDFKGKTSVSFKGDEMVGITKEQIAELKGKGVVLEPAEGIAAKNGKVTFKSLTIDNVTVSSKAELSALLSKKPALLSKVLITKPTLWKTAKSAGAQAVKAAFRVDLNPELKGKTPEEQRSNVVADVIDGEGSIESRTITPEQDATDAEKAKIDQQNSELANVQSNLQDEIKAGSEAVAAGGPAPNPTYMNNMGYELSARDSEKAIAAMTGTNNIAGQLWSFVNVLDPVDFVCSIYQTAQTAMVLSRAAVLLHATRMAVSFISMVEKYKAGDGESMKQMEFFMATLQKPDPVSQLGFGDSAIVQSYMVGKLPSEPASITALGGAGIKALSAGMLAIHGAVGEGIGGNARDGRRALRSFCGIVTNLGVQIGLTVGVAVASFFTGGGAAAGAIGAKTAISGLKEGLKAGGVQFIKQMVKDYLETFLTKNTLKTVLKDSAKNSWKTIKNMWSGMSLFQKAGIALAGVASFGMPYIVESLSGTDVLASLDSGFKFAETSFVGYENFNWTSAVAQGGSGTTLAAAQTYLNSDYRPAQQAYIAMMQQDAINTPLDITNPYSAVGSALSSFRNTFGANPFSSVASSFTSFMSVPFKLPGMFGSKAGATSAGVTLQEMSDYTDDQNVRDLNLAVMVSGTPFATFMKRFSFQDILDKLVSNSDPQISYDGETENGEPKLSIIPGSKLEEYKNYCHNPNRTNLDPMLWSGDTIEDSPESLDSACLDPGYSAASNGSQLASNGVVLAAATSDLSNTRSFNPLYADAIRFLSVANPDTSLSDATTTAAASSTGQIANGFAWIVDKKWYDDPATHYALMKGHQQGSDWYFNYQPVNKRFAMDMSPSGFLGTPVYALADGVVHIMPNDRNAAFYIESTINGKVLKSLFAHGQKITVKDGETVKAGQQVMQVGNTGNSDVPHIHWQLQYDGMGVCGNDILNNMANGTPIDLGALTTKATENCLGRA